MKNPQGLAAFKRLVKKADVVVENFRPNVKKRLGIDYKALARVNPRLVYASISGFGQDGPYAGRPGFDQIAQGMGGLMSITGPAGHGPYRVGIPIADLTAGLFAALGILVALLERDKSGKGQAVATSLLQAQIFMLDFQAARYLVEGEVAQQAGNNHPTTVPTGVFKTKDGLINIATTGGKCGTAFAKPSAMRLWRESPHTPLPLRDRGIATRSTMKSKAISTTTAAPIGSNGSTPPACHAGRSIPSTKCLPIRRCGILKSRKPSAAGRGGGSHCLPSRCRCRARPPVWSGGRPVKASIPARCSRSSAFPNARLPRCARRRRSEQTKGAMTAKQEIKTMSQTDKILARKEAGVGLVTFNNPERHNAVSLEMWEATARVLTDFAADNEVRVVVLTGAGGEAFVSGADISKFASERASIEATRAYDVVTAAAFDSVYQFPKPTIAMIRGYCIGGGAALAVCCDLRVCTDNSVFAVPAAKLGLGYGYAGLKRLTDVVGLRSPRRFSTPRGSSPPPRRSPWVSSIAWCRPPSSRPLSRALPTRSAPTRR